MICKSWSSGFLVLWVFCFISFFKLASEYVTIESRLSDVRMIPPFVERADRVMLGDAFFLLGQQNFVNSIVFKVDDKMSDVEILRLEMTAINSGSGYLFFSVVQAHALRGNFDKSEVWAIRACQVFGEGGCKSFQHTWNVIRSKNDRLPSLDWLKLWRNRMIYV